MRWAGGALLAAALGFLAYVFLRTPCCLTEEEVARREDRNSLRQLVELLRQGSRNGRLPMKDGALDVLMFVKRGDIAGPNLRLFDGADIDELNRGDYTSFRWERHRGDGSLDGPPFPLLWEKKPDGKGMVLVGLSDGTAVYWEAAKLAAALKGNH